MSTRLSRGRSTPEIRATVPPLALPLLVTRVRADDQNLPAPADDPATVAHLLHRWTNLHPRLTCTCTPRGPSSGRMAIVPQGPCPRGGSGCSASASSPRCGPGPYARSPIPPGTWRWATALRPSPRPRSRPSSASSGCPWVPGSLRAAHLMPPGADRDYTDRPARTSRKCLLNADQGVQVFRTHWSGGGGSLRSGGQNLVAFVCHGDRVLE